MFCFIYKLLISWSMDSGKPVPAYVERHMNRCDACREFSRAGEILSERLIRDAQDITSPQVTELSEKIISSLSYSRPSTQTLVKRNFLNRPVLAYGFALVIFVASVVWMAMPGKLAEPDFTLGDSPVVAFLKGDGLQEITEKVESPIHQELDGIKQAVSSAKDFFISYLDPGQK